MKSFLLMLFTAINLAVFAQDASVIQLEYFFDADKGVGKNALLNVTPAADEMFQFTVGVSSLSVGYHELYIRTKDSNGKWSFAARRNVEVFAPDAKTTIVSGEYFIDADPGYGAALPITIETPDSIVLQNFTAATSKLSVGYHKLYGRVKDNLGRWSLTFRRNMEVYKNDTNYLYTAEYFFKTDNGYGNCTDAKFGNPSIDGTFSFTIPINQIPAGADTLFVRVQDSAEGKWSLTTIANLPTPPLPLTLLNFNVVKQNNTAQLTWQTASEVNTAYFNVQRSTDGRNFATIGKVAAKNSSGNNDYAVTYDIRQLPSNKIYYRLEMADRDGKTTYSNIKAIDISSSLKIFANPNPVVNGSVQFTIYSPANAKLQLAIYNSVGKLIHNEQFNMQTGSVTKTVSLSNLAAGSYFGLITNGTSIQTVKFIKE